MDILLDLENENFDKLREVFRRKGWRLTKQQFVGALLQRMPTGSSSSSSHQRQVDLVNDITKMFDSIDAGGEGSVGWAEFTAYCVDLGSMATQQEATQLRFEYALRDGFEDTTTRAPSIDRITWLPGLQQVRGNAENTSHSKRSAAPSSRSFELSFGCVLDSTLVPTFCKGERQTHRMDAHNAL